VIEILKKLVHWCPFECLGEKLGPHSLFLRPKLGGRLLVRYGLWLFLLVVTSFVWLWTSWLLISLIYIKQIVKQNKPRCWNYKNVRSICTLWLWYGSNMSQPHFEGSVRMKLTLEIGTWKSSETPKTLEFNYRGQNTSHWGVFYIIEKLLKCRCRKWPCMDHLDICNTSYGQKKGRKSNWQFDSWPLKVGNRPNPSVCRWSATHCWKAIEERYNFA